MKILIVEDERKLGQLLKQGLSEAGYGATVAATCAAARDALCETTFDAIVLDLGLPDGDGLEAQIKQKSTRLNSSHLVISYAVFCLKKKMALLGHRRNEVL